MGASGDSQIELALAATQASVPVPGTPGARRRPARRSETAEGAAPAAAPPVQAPVPAASAVTPGPKPESSLTEHVPAPPGAIEAAGAPASHETTARRPHQLERRLTHFARLMRLDKPIGIWLLLWPELWALWIASAGHPNRRLLAIFLCGTVLMRSAGCVINDLIDRNIDPHVKRTRSRPLAARVVTPYEAIAIFTVLLLAAGVLALQLNPYTLRLAFIGAGLTVSYPLFKRFFPLPQLYLGLCFGWAVPMAFGATQGTVPRVGWLLLLAAMLWAGVYDTMYAMTDRDDDLRLGVQSSAILFAELDRFMIGVMQAMVLFALLLVGRSLHFGTAYEGGLIVGAVFFLWQQWLIRHRDREACQLAFRNNQFFGVAVFAGILLEYVAG
jgi:4-hydroxybenzoate polyprenyltransferase